MAAAVIAAVVAALAPVAAVRWAGAGRGNFSGARRTAAISAAPSEPRQFQRRQREPRQLQQRQREPRQLQQRQREPRTTSTSTVTSTSAVVATEALITGEVGAASPPASRRVPSSAVPLPVRPIRPRHTRTRLVHTQITRIADFERLQHDGFFERLLNRVPVKRSRESGWRVLAGFQG